MGLAVDVDGTLVATELVSSQPDPNEPFVYDARVFRLNPETCEELDIARGGYLVAPAAVAIEADGNVLVTDSGVLVELEGSVPGRLVRINSASYEPEQPLSNQQLVVESILLAFPRGITVVPEPSSHLTAVVALLSLLALLRKRGRTCS